MPLKLTSAPPAPASNDARSVLLPTPSSHVADVMPLGAEVVLACVGEFSTRAPSAPPGVQYTRAPDTGLLAASVTMTVGDGYNGLPDGLIVEYDDGPTAERLAAAPATTSKRLPALLFTVAPPIVVDAANW